MSSKEKNNIEDCGGIWKTLRKAHNWRLLWIGIFIVLIVLSAGGNIEGEIGHLLKNFGIELGFAIFIAVFLSVSIEEFTRRQFHDEMYSRIREIQQNVFRSTYSRNLPVEFFNEVENLLFRCRFSYQSYRIEYDFDKPKLLTKPSSLYVMNVIIRHIFFARNLTALPSEHCICLQIQELPYVSDANCPRILSVIMHGDSTFEPEKIEEINKNAESDGRTRTFRIQTDEVPPSDAIEVRIEAQSTICVDGFAFCRCSAPTSGLTVNAKFPPEIDPARVGTDTAHRIMCKPIVFDHSKTEFTWAISGAILPSQGINFWWACDLEKMSKIKIIQ